MFRRFTHKRSLVALSVVAMLVVAGAAIAFFTSTGNGTGSASVGSATHWTANVSSDTSNGLYPGAGSETLTYTIHNGSTGHQSLAGTSAVVAHDVSGNILDHNVAVSGCKAADFTAANTAPTLLPQNLAGGGDSTAGSVLVTMQDSGLNQDACQGHSVDITVSAN